MIDYLNTNLDKESIQVELSFENDYELMTTRVHVVQFLDKLGDSFYEFMTSVEWSFKLSSTYIQDDNHCVFVK